MGLISSLFGGKPSIEKLRKALERGNYAEALHIGEDLLAATGETAEVAAGLIAASDGLARMNLDEGIRSLQAGNTQLAEEHLRLALSQARSTELIKDVEDRLTQGPCADQPLPPVLERAEAAPAPACGGCSPAPQQADVSADELPDLQSQIELIIASYPPEMQQRYLARSKPFLKAFLLVHSGEDQQALPFWEEVPREERDEFYLFELGCLYGRLGETDRGMKLLRQALELDPGNWLMIDALLSMLLDGDDLPAARQLLQKQLEKGANPAFCHGRLCELQAANQDSAAAFDSARKALAAGYAEPGFLVLAAELLEAAGETEEAEGLLSGLPGGGCGGGVNLPLAEFWLRQNRELARVLDAFNGACRQEPDNPRWQLRVAQTYLARKWRKQGLELLRRVVGDPRLDDALRHEAEQLLAEA
jgi:tetratricopeptide (TPR) repeat protein